MRALVLPPAFALSVVLLAVSFKVVNTFMVREPGDTFRDYVHDAALLLTSISLAALACFVLVGSVAWVLLQP